MKIVKNVLSGRSLMDATWHNPYRHCTFHEKKKLPFFDTNQRNVPGRKYLGKFLLGTCRWPLRAATPLQSIIDSILVAFGQICNFLRSQLSHFPFMCVSCIEKRTLTHHLQCRHSGMFANRKKASKKQKMCRPLLSNSIETAMP